MNNKLLYAVTGLFDTPDEIINAAKTVSDKGFKRFDINTPYPVHGMFNAMKLKPSTLGYFALVFGLTGTFSALLFMWYTSAYNYPLVIGGKPFFQLPAFIPITFELTVLLASIGTVVTMLFLFFKLPNNSHPLHDTDYMRQVSNDMFGVCVEAFDKEFNEDEVKSLFQQLGAKNITSIYLDEKQLLEKPAIFEPKFILFLVGVALTFSILFYFFMNKIPYLQPFNWLMDQFKVTVQTKSNVNSNGFPMRLPVAGTIARGNLPYQLRGMPDSVAKDIMNPLPFTDINLTSGKKNFDIFCSPCHGFHAKGDSRLRNQFPNPPSLHSEKIRNWSDGQIYHIITEGQNIMPSYDRQVEPEERWQIILYIRALQRAMNAKEEDLK